MNLTFDDSTLRQLVRPIAEEIVVALREGESPDEPLSLTEADAARRLGMATHQLRDRRLAGEITGSKLGGRWFYETTELRDYLRRNRTT